MLLELISTLTYDAETVSAESSAEEEEDDDEEESSEKSD